MPKSKKSKSAPVFPETIFVVKVNDGSESFYLANETETGAADSAEDEKRVGVYYLSRVEREVGEPQRQFEEADNDD